MKNSKKAIKASLMAVLSFILMALATDPLVCCTVVTDSKYKALMEDSERAATQTAIHAAYSELLHRLWIEHPNLVEESLMDTDEFYRLDSILGGDFEDTFLFWNEEDSINYHTNWGLGE